MTIFWGDARMANLRPLLKQFIRSKETGLLRRCPKFFTTVSANDAVRHRGLLLENLEKIDKITEKEEFEKLFNDQSIVDTFRDLLRRDDLSLAGGLLKAVIFKLIPQLNKDGNLSAMYVGKLLDPHELEKDPLSAYDRLAKAMDTLESTCKMINKNETSIDFVFRLILERILDLADDVQMDRWLRLAVDKIEAAPPHQLELMIAQVYLKRNRWDKICELLVTLQSHLGYPSECLFAELFQVLLLEDPRGKCFTGQIDALQTSFVRLQEELERWKKAGVKLSSNGAVALESLMLKTKAPPSFIEYLEGWYSEVDK